MVIQQRVAAWLRARPSHVDSAIAVGLAAASLTSLFIDGRDDGAGTMPHPVDALGVLLVLATCLPLAVRRRLPMLSLLGVAAPTYAELVLNYNGLGGLGLVIAVYTVAAWRDRTAALAALLLGWLAFFGTLPFTPAHVDVASMLAVLAIVFGAFAFGRSTAFRRAYTSELEKRARRLEDDRVTQLRTVVTEERSRIARELHDVVAHHVSVMTVQASAAQRTIERNPAAAREAMAAVEGTGRAALVEMRRMVEVLRAADQAPTELAPQPGLAALGGLVESVREAGVPVEVSVTGSTRPLDAGVDLVAYRVAQEALTNVLKHAGPARARVEVVYLDEHVVVGVEDDGRGNDLATAGGAAGGHGLLGMRERVTLFGGELQVGPRQGGGFGVRVVLPALARPAVLEPFPVVAPDPA